jgi:hypothetical protein
MGRNQHFWQGPCWGTQSNYSLFLARRWVTYTMQTQT